MLIFSYQYIIIQVCYTTHHEAVCRGNVGDLCVGGSLLKVEEALQSSKTECRGRWRRGRLQQYSETSAVAVGVDQ